MHADKEAKHVNAISGSFVFLHQTVSCNEIKNIQIRYINSG